MRTLFALAAVTLLLGACAPAAGGGTMDGPMLLPIEVRNNYPTAVSRDIYIAEITGSRRRVGQVPASATRRLDARGVDFDAQHVLLAESIYEATIESEPFFVSPGGRVIWNLTTNRIEVIQP